MPIEHTVWKIGEHPQRLQEQAFDQEAELEEMVAADMGILDDQWLLIGRQVTTAYNKKIDLLAIDASGSLIVIELKKQRTPREVVAQAIDYATWVQGLDASAIADIYERFQEQQGSDQPSLDQALQAKFGRTLDEDDLNSSHQMVIVASELDSSTERIVRYLSDYGVAINVVFFRVFADGDNRYLSRAWFMDPSDTQERATTPRGNEPWNNEFYVSFGHGSERDWQDAREYGFISAGGGRWYSKTLNMLSIGDRVWVNVPKTGYVGVGVVEAPAVKFDEFVTSAGNNSGRLGDGNLRANYHREYMDDEDKAEYAVAVKWIEMVALNQAHSELGFFGNQNTVARPTTPKWPHTVERLKQLFHIE